MGIKPLPHFENLLHTFAMQYKIKVQGNIETVCLLNNRKSKPDSYVDLSINMEDYHRSKNEEK